jgi:hypothetical protein
MNIDPFLIWLESTWLSQWVVNSPSLLAFPGIICLHAIGMGFAVGISVIIDLQVLGFAPGVRLEELRRYLPILWVGFWINAVSGVLLLVAYPTKALTNPVFHLKLTLIGVAMVLLVRISRGVFGDGTHPVTPDARRERRLRRLAVVSLVCWTGAIFAGRLLAYTYTRLTATE